MPWSIASSPHGKDPRTIYAAPPEAHPILQVIYDPSQVRPWSVVYDYLSDPSDTQASIQALMGL